MFRINLVTEMLFDSKVKAEKVMDELVTNDILCDIAEVTKQAHPYKENKFTIFEKPGTIEKFKDYKKRKKL